METKTYCVVIVCNGEFVANGIKENIEEKLGYICRVEEKMI